MNILVRHLLLATCLLCISKYAVCADLKINALGCVLSIPGVTDITVSGSADITFSFRKSELLPLELITITRYPGDEAWHAKQPEKSNSEAVHSKYLNFDLKTITFKGRFPPGTTFRELTDGKVVLFFKGKESDISRFLECSK